MPMTRPAADPFQQLRDPAEVFKNPDQQSFIRNFVGMVRQSLANTVQADRSAPSVMLTSPGGKVYRLTVSDAGVVSATYVQG